MTDADDRDWFGNPLPPAAPPVVACPRCGAPHDDGARLRAHLLDEHGVAAPTRRDPSPGRGARARARWKGLSHLPLWFVLPADAALVLLVGAALWPHDAHLATYAAALCTLPLVLVLSARLGHR